LVATNGQGFLLCWYSVIRQPEPLLGKVNVVDVIFCCSVLFVQPDMLMITNGTISIYSSASIAEKPLCYIEKRLEQEVVQSNFGYKNNIVHPKL